jgi:hypothetical protein
MGTCKVLLNFEAVLRDGFVVVADWHTPPDV